MARGYVKTIRDLEELYYGGSAGYVLKSDANVLSTTTGVYNPIYGAKVWSQLNQEANAFGILPKEVWGNSGWRVITVRAATSGGGVAQDGAIPATIRPTFAQVSTTPKNVAHAFGASEVQQFLGTVDDSLGDTMAVLREQMAKHHAEMINIMLLGEVDTLASNNFESLDRVATSAAEVAGLGITANDADMYGLDRDVASIHDGVSLHNSGTDRDISVTLLDSAFQNVWTNGGQPKVILTHYDTLMRIQQALQTLQRFGTLETRRVVPSVEGIKGVEGYDAGFVVATYNQVPMIPSKDVVKDTVGRVYLFDTDYLSFRVAKPTQYFEAGMSVGDPFGINRLGDEGLYRTINN